MDAAAHQIWREWSAGATYCKSLGDGMWLSGVPDAETSFAIHREASPNKFGYGATHLFARAIGRVGRVPDAITPVPFRIRQETGRRPRRVSRTS